MKTQPIEPILVVDLLPDMQEQLLALLHSLTTDEWNMATVCTGWSVKDVAQHLLGDQLGILSGRRDGFSTPADVSSWDKLVAFINERNAVWVEATRRLSPRVICDLLTSSGAEVYAHFASLDSFALGGTVNWASWERVPVWLEIGREYTEYWTHQQHIRDAVNKPGLKEAKFLKPALELFVHALPVTYQPIEAEVGTLVKLVISGTGGGEWHLVRESEKWSLYRQTDLTPTCTITMDDDTAWRLFTKGISREQAAVHTLFVGDSSLGQHLLNTVSIIA